MVPLRGRQNSGFSSAYRSQTWQNPSLNCKGFFRTFPNLIRVPMRPGALAVAAKRQSFWRAAEFWLLLAAAFVSMLSVTVWIVIPLTLAGLSISSLPKYIELWPRAERVGAQGEWWKTVALSAFNRLAAAVAALVLGNLARWVWWWILLRGSCTY